MLRLGVIGAGLKAADYARSWAGMAEVSIDAMAEVSEISRDRFAATCVAAGAAAPRAYESAEAMLAAEAGHLDAVYVSTPHAFHAGNALAVLAAGLDLLLEKPMVTTVPEALALQAEQARTGKTVVIAFQGGLSPLVHDTRRRAQAGEFGELVSVSATIWEGWKDSYAGNWKQVPEISGGGFMFDTGAHMMNTVCILADSPFTRLSAYMDNRGIAVDLAAAVAGRLENGALVTLNAAGEGPDGCASSITFFYSQAIVAIDAWGGWRQISRDGVAGQRETQETRATPMQTFLAVRSGTLENPSTVANGVQFARLWDAIKASAAHDGVPVDPRTTLPAP
ncbi:MULTISPECIES: Gfo/Idh/MocA family protein [Devosia]|uniref:Gfo/Idh/MocA family protein n=1 Tax=Devosia TaxID=46913 RepID=UPI000CE9ACD4|nr:MULTISPECIES: Gfo/Idh/MocA family oxidoreductase [Devosia]AVF04352.1 oxidoreductase [Devosia sp. I507]